MKKFTLICALWATAASHAATTVYTDEAAFLANAGNLSFDSFEDLERSITTPVGTLLRPGYSLSTPAAGDLDGLYVFDFASGFGSFATDGETYLVNQTDAGERLRFDFDMPVYSFGFSLTDWDNPAMTAGAELILGNDAGDKLVVTATPQADGDALFFGIVNSAFAFSYVELGNGASSEAYGIDGIYFTRPVPVPGALWLLGSALLGGRWYVNRRR